jgi:hypothetical protein
MNDDPILATLLKVLYLKTVIAAMNSLKINKAVRNSTFNKCKLLQRQTVQLKEMS